MKTLVVLLILTISALAGDGYDLQFSSVRDLTRATVKPGQVVKLRFPISDADPAEGQYQWTAVLFDYKRGFAPAQEISFPINEAQKIAIKSCQAVYLRRTDTGWVMLGTWVSRDPNGKTVIR